MFKLNTLYIAIIYFGTLSRSIHAFTSSFQSHPIALVTKSSTLLFAEGEKAAKEVTGEELEIMLTEWDQPLLLDAYGEFS